MFWFSKEKNKTPKRELTKYDELEALVWDFFKYKIPRLGFEQREGQEDMAFDICNSIADKQHTIVEAGVGIGKSYAYIVPLLYYNKLFNKPVIIATSTIALQEQLIQDVKRISSYVNHRPEIVLAKGMTHFACKSRADKYLKPKVDKGLEEDAETLYRYIYGGKIDRKNINMDIDEELWSNVKVEITDHSKCKHFKSCRFMELRSDMLNTEGVILCNQDLLTVHLQKLRRGQKGLLNPAVDLIVVDEAHNLEEKVRSSLIESYNKNKIIAMLMEAKYGIKDKGLRGEVYQKINELINMLSKIFNNFDKQIKYQLHKNTMAEDMEKFFINIYDMRELVEKSADTIKSIYDIIRRCSDSSISDDIIDEVENIKEFFKEMAAEKSNNLFWLQKDKYVEIFACPKNMNREIKSLFFDKMKTTILTSATIADKNHGTEEERYEYFIKNTGFPVKEGFLSPQKYSPFPYNNNSIIYYTENMPHPIEDRENFIKAASEEIVELLDITKGKSLILFTSKKDLNEVYKILKDKNLPYKLLRQRATSSQDEILDEFKKNQDSVLLATGTFWEGIDVPGKALSNLIIFKLPFPVPDPIIEYKRSNSKDFLMEVSVPLMVVKLRQGVGRLIRKHEDKGIVAILDSRIGDFSKSRYKDVVFNSLPIKNKSNNINSVREFWIRINSK
ncbi:MAG: ATP-dependent DNA helicase [Clostridium sp.]|uniref:ATP-dependent DNA helicase n=1 Tax=Clostridium sp. TaxID=1506 RepID=UPI003216648B